MSEITMKFEEKTITKIQKIPDKIILDLSIEEAVALKAILNKVYSQNNYVNNIQESLKIIIGEIDDSYMFTMQNGLAMPHSSMFHCNQEAQKIRQKFSES